MKESGITFKGTLNGLTIIINSNIDFDLLLTQIENKVSQAGKFFKGAPILAKYRGKDLTFLQEKEIIKLLSEKSGAQITSIEKDTEEPSTNNNIVPHELETPNDKYKPQVRYSYFKGLEEGSTKFFRGTLRSGKRISFDGNIVIIGDINPGGEVVASGNIIVMGSLRGIVHAGADGNKDALVIALNLQPTQLRISDVITRSPDQKSSKNQYIPELAFVKDDIVYIERYLPQNNK